MTTPMGTDELRRPHRGGSQAHAAQIASVLAGRLTGATWSPNDTLPTPEPRSHDDRHHRAQRTTC